MSEVASRLGRILLHFHIGIPVPLLECGCVASLFFGHTSCLGQANICQKNCKNKTKVLRFSFISQKGEKGKDENDGNGYDCVCTSSFLWM